MGYEFLLLTPLHWAAFWSFSNPCTIMLTLPRVWTIQLIPIVAAVVGCWGVGVASHEDFAIWQFIKLGTLNCVNIICVNWCGWIRVDITYTSLHWAAFWSLPVPSAIMLTFSGVCTIQLVPIVAAVVGCWGVGATSHPDFTIFRGNKFAAVNWTKLMI